MTKFVEVIGYKVFSDNLSKIKIESLVNAQVINTISPNSYGIATKDNEFRIALQKSDYLVLDGVYFAFASVLIKGKNIKKNQGPDVFDHFMYRLNINKGKAFFLGSTDETLKLIKEKASKEYPNIRLETFSPPFKSVFSQQDNEAMINSIKDFNPNVLFVGMTCPKQEKWAIQHRDRLPNCLVICIGNVFDWYAGTQKRIHPFWFKIRMAWLIRIFLRPEIFRRNIGNQMLFFYHAVLIFIKIKK